MDGLGRSMTDPPWMGKKDGWIEEICDGPQWMGKKDGWIKEICDGSAMDPGDIRVMPLTTIATSSLPALLGSLAYFSHEGRSRSLTARSSPPPFFVQSLAGDVLPGGRRAAAPGEVAGREPGDVPSHARSGH